MGYKVEQIVAKASFNDFKCEICFEIVKEPVVVKGCEHLFCHDCISEWLQKDSKCPVDRTPIVTSDLVAPNRFFRNQYNQLKIQCHFAKVKKFLKSTNSLVSCLFAQAGCNAVVPFDHLESHLLECEYKQISCLRECGFVGDESQLQDHDCFRYLKDELKKAKNANASHDVYVIKLLFKSYLDF